MNYAYITPSFDQEYPVKELTMSDFKKISPDEHNYGNYCMKEEDIQRDLKIVNFEIERYTHLENIASTCIKTYKEKGIKQDDSNIQVRKISITFIVPKIFQTYASKYKTCPRLFLAFKS